MSSIVEEMSRCDIPRAYMDNTFPSMFETSFDRLGTITGSNDPSLSLGVLISTSPIEVFKVLGLEPFLLFFVDFDSFELDL